MNQGNQDWDDLDIDKKIVSINRNGVFTEGKTLYLELDWELDIVLQSACQRLEIPTASRVFNADGVEIDDSMMIEDGDMLFLSAGEDFISPLEDEEEPDPESKDGSDNLPASIGGYKVGDFLGKGSFGEVRVGEHPLNNEKVALKFINKRSIMTISAAERTMTEIQCLAALKHPGIISLFQHVETPNHVVLVFEIMFGGDLNEYLQKRGSSPAERALAEDVGRNVFVQIVNAVSYAHHQHICHRDLKLENILLKQDSLVEVKVADFGLSDFYRPGSTRKSFCGTLSFLAPEGFHNQANAGPPLDVWSLGVILFAMLSGRLPFDGDLKSTRRPREQVIRNKILKGQYRLDERLGIEVKDLIRRMLKLDPGERASVPEVINHVWFKSSADHWMTSRSRSGSMSRSRSGSMNRSNDYKGGDERLGSPLVGDRSPGGALAGGASGEVRESGSKATPMQQSSLCNTDALPPAATKDALDAALASTTTTAATAITSSSSDKKNAGTVEELMLAGMQPLPGLTRNESSDAVKIALSPRFPEKERAEPGADSEPGVGAGGYSVGVADDDSALLSARNKSKSPSEGLASDNSSSSRLHSAGGEVVSRIDSINSTHSEEGGTSANIGSESSSAVQHSFKLMPLRRAGVSNVEEQDRRWGEGNSNNDGSPTVAGSSSSNSSSSSGSTPVIPLPGSLGARSPTQTEQRDFDRRLAGFAAGENGVSIETGATSVYLNCKDNSKAYSTATISPYGAGRTDELARLAEKQGDSLQAAINLKTEEKETPDGSSSRGGGRGRPSHAMTRSNSAMATRADPPKDYSQSPALTRGKTLAEPGEGQRGAAASPIPIPISTNSGVNRNPGVGAEEGLLEPRLTPRGRSIGAAGSQVIGGPPSS